ncbi:hypothetical protein [Paraburkholderia terricola]|uniref:hypothetical protein n=1 Tax=Paraburkholderia terricola TaxID=169427 RepID=UPI00286C7110|nr:hypothetical protein [Paraburkholderia terricola]
MGGVEGPTSGAGSVDWSNTDVPAAESRPQTRRPASHPAFGGLTAGQPGRTVDAAFARSKTDPGHFKPASERVRPEAGVRTKLENFGYTSDQIADVSNLQGPAGLEALSEAHSAMSAALTGAETPLRIEQLTRIVGQTGGVEALRALAQHWSTIYWHVSTKEICGMAAKPDGAKLIRSKALKISDIYDVN